MNAIQLGNKPSFLQKRSVVMPGNFWCLHYASDTALEMMLNTGSVVSPDLDFTLKVSAGDCIVLANYDEVAQCGLVRAFGLVAQQPGADPKLTAAWRAADVTLRPRPQGRQFWRRPYFRFADDVVQRYMLPSSFAEHFSDAATEVENSFRLEQATEHASLSCQSLVGGYVYVIRSPYGYKIGKTKHLADRTRLFSVKLPFPIELVHYSWFDDYSKAERDLHRRFQNKRLEGEWFDLGDTDLENIRMFGDHPN